MHTYAENELSAPCSSYATTPITCFAWAALYFTTPFIVFVLWLRNRSRDPGPNTFSDRRMPRLMRLVIGIVGDLTLLTSIFLFLQPGFMISIWPWQLTPLSARVMGALFALTGVGELTIALDVRWSAARIALQSQMIGIVAIGLAQERKNPRPSSSCGSTRNS